MFLVDRADVAEGVIVAVRVWVLALRHVTNSLYIAFSLTDTVVAGRVVVSTAVFALQVSAWSLSVLSVL